MRDIQTEIGRPASVTLAALSALWALTARWRPLLLAACAWALLAVPAPAQSPFEDDEEVPDVIVTFETKIEPAVARPGEHVRLIVTAHILEGWYIYSLEPQGEFAPPPTLLTLSPENGLAPVGPPYEVNAKVKTDQVFDMTLAYHIKAARFYQNFQVPEGEPAGELPMNAVLRYQACNDRICTPPRKEPLLAALTVENGDLRPPYAFLQRTIDFLKEDGEFLLTADTLDEALSQGLLGFIMLAVAFGFLALLTPCVFPMIPITVTFFTSAAKERDGNTLGLAVMFGLGIVVTYTGLGLALTFLLGATGTSQFATNPWVNLVVAGFFIVFALSLIGVFSLALPASWVQAVDQKARVFKGPVGVMVMGLAFTATSFTCTVQFVGTLLIAAVVGELFWPVLGMLIFSTIFALPFFLLALFPKFVMSFRGRSGPWLGQMKVILGILELLIAMKFVSNADLVWGWGIFDRELLLVMGAVVVAVSALLILGLVPWPGFKVDRLRAPRIGWSAAFLLLAVYFVRGAQGVELDAYTEAYLPPPLGRDTVVQAAMKGEYLDDSSVHGLPWLLTLDDGLRQAQASGKPIFIDFTGYTCINCRWMEKRIFAEKSVYEAFRDRFVLVQLYTDGGDHAEENQRLQVERFRTLALPYYVILSPDNAVLAKHAGITPNPADFLAWLDHGQRQMVAIESPTGETTR